MEATWLVDFNTPAAMVKSGKVSSRINNVIQQ
jgi:hypothetical protein